MDRSAEQTGTETGRRRQVVGGDRWGRFGALLGGPAASLQSASAAGGIADLAEVSLLLPAELDALQGDPVVLGKARFSVVSGGASTVTVSQAIVGNGEGRALRVTSTGSVRVDAGPAIPEPGALALFALGLTAIAPVLRRATTPS